MRHFSVILYAQFPFWQWLYLPCPKSSLRLPKGVSTLIRIVRKLLTRVRRRPAQAGFNSRLLEQHRDDAFAVMHQQIGGLR